MAKSCSKIPDFDDNGNLPPGVYVVSIDEIERSFTWTTIRRQLFGGLKRALANLAVAGVKRVWIGGSFVTADPHPDDVDGCWEPNESMDVNELDNVFLDTRPPRQSMKNKYGVDFLNACAVLADPDAQGQTVQDYFQEDRNGNPKGILIVEIGDQT